MPGVLFEGGSFRAIFSCGVMDALLDQDVMFPYCIGVSELQIPPVIFRDRRNAI